MIEIRYEGNDLKRLKQIYDPVKVEKAYARTKNRLLSRSATALNKKIREQYVIKAKDVNKALTRRKAIAGRQGFEDAVLEYIGRRLPLAMFNPKDKVVRVVSKHFGKKIKRRVVTVKVSKAEGRKPILSVPAFLTNRGTTVHARKTAERESYKTPSMFSIPEVMETKKQLAEFDKVISENFQPEFEHQMDYYLGRLTG